MHGINVYNEYFVNGLRNFDYSVVVSTAHDIIEEF